MIKSTSIRYHLVVILWECTQKSIVFGLNKRKNPNILVVLVLVNYTNVLQPTDVIFQCPLKHAFNNWTIGVIKQHIRSGKDPNVDFKMNNLKPWNCEWLHNAWKELRSKQTMILKGWEKTRLLRAWNNEFQLVAMETKTNYFSIYSNTWHWIRHGDWQTMH